MGSGEKISKKKYVFHKFDKKVLIPDLYKLFIGLKKLNLLKEYEEYLLYDSRDLFAWFRANNIDRKQYQQWMKYNLDSGDSLFEDRGKKEILLFVKDAYGCPYVPGSSLKGAIRTALLSGNMIKNKNSYNKFKSGIRQARYNGKRYLSREANDIENEAFNILNRNKKKYDAVNDCLAGIRISDSKPISVSDLVLCQKVDVSVDGTENKLNVLRECVMPHKKIEFDLTIDTQLCIYEVSDIINAINAFFDCCQDVFLEAFKRNKVYQENSFYLGGGSGYVSKTMSYPLFGKEEGVKAVSEIIDNTLPYRLKNEHKHRKDPILGVSPHMLKCTRYNGILYEMGLCKMDIVKST